MIEIKLPGTIKVGGFDYSIELSQKHDRELRSDNNWGECSGYLRRIRIDTQSSPVQFSETFLHEIIHAIDHVYGNCRIIEEDTSSLANGLLQVFEQLGIRFVKGQ